MTHSAAEFKALLNEIEFLRGTLERVEKHCEESKDKAEREGFGMVAAHFDGIAVLIRESLLDPKENGRRIEDPMSADPDPSPLRRTTKLSEEVEERLKRIEASVRETSDEIAEYRRTRSGTADVLARAGDQVLRVTAERDAWVQAFEFLRERCEDSALPFVRAALIELDRIRRTILATGAPPTGPGLPAGWEDPDAPEGNVARPGGSI